MNNRLGLNLLLVLLAAGLIWWIAFKPPADEPDAGRLFRTAPHEAATITISHPDRPPITLEKQQGQWQLTEPATAPLNPERIKHLLTILHEPIVSRYPLDENDLASFGLDANAIQLAINGEQATFGNTNPVTRNRYVLKDGALFTIAEIIYGTLGSSLTNLLNHQLLPQHSPLNELTAPAAFNTAPEDWQNIKATDIAEYSGDEATLGIITATLQNNSEIQISVLALQPALILGRDDLRTRYTFDAASSERLLHKP